MEEATQSSVAVEFMPLDPRVVKLWRLTRLITTAVFSAALFIVGSVVAARNPHLLLWFLSGWMVLFVAGVSWAIFYPPRAYRAWGYRIDEKVLETRSGIWFRVLRLLPLSRLQHVDLHRGPLERAHGLASLVLHTAGTQEAVLIIPGLDAEEAFRLRDQLLAAGGDDAV